MVITTNRWYRKKYNKPQPSTAPVANPITTEHIPLKEKGFAALGPTETKSCKKSFTPLLARVYCTFFT